MPSLAFAFCPATVRYIGIWRRYAAMIDLTFVVTLDSMLANSW